MHNVSSSFPQRWFFPPRSPFHQFLKLPEPIRNTDAMAGDGKRLVLPDEIPDFKPGHYQQSESLGKTGTA
jgi:hypothetical protein